METPYPMYRKTVSLIFIIASIKPEMDPKELGISRKHYENQ